MNEGEDVVFRARAFFHSLSIADRLRFIEIVTAGYCKECGVAHPKQGTCKCWNDD